MILSPWRKQGKALSLRAKVTIWSVISMIWVGMLGGTGLVFTAHLAGGSRVLVEDLAIPVIKMGEIETAAWRVYLGSILHTGLTAPKEMKAQSEEIDAWLVILEQRVSAYQKNSDATKTWLSDFLKVWQQFTQTINHARKLSHGYAKEEAMQILFLEGKKHFDNAVAIVAGDRHTHWKEMGALRNDAALAEQRAMQWLISVTLLCGVMVVVGWLYARTLSTSLADIASNLTSAVSEIGATVTEQGHIMAQQAASVHQINTTMEELGASARQTSDQAEVAAHGTHSALEFSKQGTDRVGETLRNMENTKNRVEAIVQQILRLSEKTGQIKEIAILVSDFANETKMLAMNAAVEAVRAGKYGKGFSVLAVETRKLADESKRSAGQIASLIDSVQKATNATVMAAEEGDKSVRQGIKVTRNTASTFDSLEGAIGDAYSGASQISMNVRQQAIAVKQVVDTMKSITMAAKESAVGITQVKSSIQLLGESAQTLYRML